MAIEVSINHPAFPKDTPFGIADLGIIPNGGSLSIDEDMERSFVASRQMPLKEAFENSDTLKVKGSSTLKGKEASELIATHVSDNIVAPENEEEGGES